MRLGGPVFGKHADAQAWIAAHRELGYSAAFGVHGQSEQGVADCVALAAENDLVLAEVGAWSNPLSDDPTIRRDAIDRCIAMLGLAERIGARCCVNITGSRGERWDGPHPENFSEETFDRIVQVVRQIIDAVKPTRIFYTLETMPWIWPDGPDEYLQLFRAIDRKAFGVHLDPVNLVNNPRRAYNTGALIRDCFEKLGPHIRSCHAKDIRLGSNLTLHLDECLPGTGLLDYAEYLRQLNRLDPDTPLMLEHMASPQEYARAADHIRRVADEQKVVIR